MRKLTIMSIGLLFFACGSEESTETTTESSNISEESTEIVDENTVEENVEVNGNKPFFIEDFPHNWIQLSPSEESENVMVIDEYCDAGTPSMEWVAQKGESWLVTMMYGQDAEQFDLTNFEAHEEVTGVNSIIKGTFDLTSHYADGKDYHVNFEWDKAEHHCKFENMGFECPYFVSSQDKTNFQVIKEDCEDFWQ
ncbi:hypothetical protein K6119_12290 [Paracrocinitomix mangrovi]|uniref:hypothetical protein n=1 Tax=Paracrocinitomix mangrovi TaxID=2862509 RepID=UPI001C8E0902|nr:hypothetical protein [Paracrocinitomix mangrovi]UKN00511.1 hypothetical protein K6119_12290 [Paracrocinitomix mangrovi]